MSKQSDLSTSRGSIVIYLIAALAVLSVIGVASTGMFSSSTMGTAQVNEAAAAQYLAESGIRYAESQLRAQADLASLTAMATTLDATTYTVDGAGSFDLAVDPPVAVGGTYSVTVTTSLGSSGPAGSETTHQITSTVVQTNIAVAGGGSEADITFDPEDGGNGVDDFPPAGTGGQGAADFVKPNTDDQTLVIGNNARASYGCAWYTGDQGTCTDGVCDFGSGFRAYFDAMFSYNARADGFVFAIISGSRNTVNDCGGDTSRGELLAYAGGGNTGRGLRAPKLGLEFDIYANTGEGNVCSVSQRNDYNGSDHVAWLAWGNDYWSGGCDETYDDNRHGAGGWGGTHPVPPNAATPTNPINIDEKGFGADGYYYPEGDSDWIRSHNSSNSNKKFRIRIEVDRSQTANANGNYGYTLRGWIVKDSDTMPDGLDDVSEDYYDPADESTWPQVEHMVVLGRSLHGYMDKMIFGWTAATGGSTKTLTLSDFKLKFKDDPSPCEAETKPTDYVLAIPMYEGQGGSMKELVGTGSSWSGDAHWTAGRSCPGSAGRYFDDDHSPAPFWSNPAQALTTQGTVSTWVYLTKHEEYQGILMNGTNQETFSMQFSEHRLKNRGNTMRFNPDRRSGPWYRIDDGDEKPMFCIIDGGVAYCVDAKYKLETGRWYHLTSTWNAATDEMQFFVNGTRTAYFKTTDVNAAWDLPAIPVNPPWSNVMLVGGLDTGNNYNFQGMIDEIYMYDRVLTDEEITALYTDGNRRFQE